LCNLQNFLVRGKISSLFFVYLSPSPRGINLPVADSCLRPAGPPARSRRIHAPSFIKDNVSALDFLQEHSGSIPLFQFVLVRGKISFLFICLFKFIS
jgi:hypothetical protein